MKGPEILGSPTPHLLESGLVVLTDEAKEAADEARRAEAEAQSKALAKATREGGEVRADIKIGICRACSKQRQLWRPANLCTECLRNKAQEHGLEI